MAIDRVVVNPHTEEHPHGLDLPAYERCPPCSSNITLVITDVGLVLYQSPHDVTSHGFPCCLAVIPQASGIDVTRVVQEQVHHLEISSGRRHLHRDPARIDAIVDPGPVTSEAPRSRPQGSPEMRFDHRLTKY